MDLPGPALPPSINPALGPSVSVVSGLFFFFFSQLKYFAKDQVIGVGRGMGAEGNALISSEADGVNLQHQLKRK